MIRYEEVELAYISNGMIGPGHYGRWIRVMKCLTCLSLIMPGDEESHTAYHDNLKTRLRIGI